MSDLKPCPFCGGEAKLVRTWHLHHISCRSCGANIGEIKRHPNDFRTRDEVIVAWNRRSIDRDELLLIADDLDDCWESYRGENIACEDINNYEQKMAALIRKAVGA